MAAVGIQFAVGIPLILFLLRHDNSALPVAQPGILPAAGRAPAITVSPADARRGGGGGGGMVITRVGTGSLEGDGFILKVDHAGATGFKPASADDALSSTMVNGKRVIHKWTMGQFADFIQGAIGAPIVDQTGLIGEYNFELSPPRLFAAEERIEKVKESLLNELGLKLEPNTKHETAK
jgi:hypothetical protein